MRSPISHSIALVGFLALTLPLIGCSGTSGSGVGSPDTVGVMSMDVNRYPVNRLVCNPLAPSTPSQNFQAGLKAKLYYLDSRQPHYTDVESYINNGHLSNQDLFFADLNVPTRLFSLGFANESGNTVKDDQGNLLIEYFGMRFNAAVKLAHNQNDGYYQFATLSDDGAIWTMQDDQGNMSNLVNVDGTHPTVMGCSTNAVSFDSTTKRPMQLDYYQGPRYHIALVTMMRKVSSANAALDPMCGHGGNETFFDYNNFSLPTTTYIDLLSRGWVAMTPDNFVIPDDAQFNPCKAGTNPVISNFTTIESTGTSIEVRWTTDIPATTQVSFSDPVHGTSGMTLSDNTLSTNHIVYVTGLQRGTLYQLQAISISADYGRTVSNAIFGSTSQ